MKALHFFSAYLQLNIVSQKYNEVEILLVEDNMHDAELVVRALCKVNLANHVVHVKDGAEALDFIFAKGEYASREAKNTPRVILLDIKMPEMNG